MEFSLKYSGYAEASQHLILRGKKRKTIKIYSTFGIIKHPQHGIILFDTGYSERFYEYTKKFPYSIHTKIAKVLIKKEEKTVSTLEKLGIKAESVQYIIISHFHVDHVGGLKDFPNATFICNKIAYDDIKGIKGLQALKKGFIPMFIPNNFESRMKLIDFNTAKNSNENLGKIIDLFDDNKILLCELEGHAKGQIGAILNTVNGQIFLAADACWAEEAYKENWLPSKMARFIFEDWSEYITTLQKVQGFHRNNPKTTIIPCHCEKTMRRTMK